MAFTLSNALQAAYMKMGMMFVSKVVTGSTTTVVDGTKAYVSSDDAWKEGALFVIRDAGGASAAPEGEFNRISAYVNSSGTYTVDTAFTAATAVGDTYGYVSQRFPLQLMIQLANLALLDLGDVDLVDTTTLDTIANTTEYAASVAWKRTRPFRIDVQTVTGNTADNQWRPYWDFEYTPAVAGSAGRIFLPDYQIASRDIRVWYRAPHPTLTIFSSAIAEVHSPAIVVAAIVAKAYDWENRGNNGADAFVLQTGQKAEQHLMDLQTQRPPSRTKSRSRLLITGPGLGGPDADDFTIG